MINSILVKKNSAPKIVKKFKVYAEYATILYPIRKQITN